MKIAVIHCKYLEPGGEDIVFEQECLLLSKTENVEVITFYNKPGLKGLFQFLFCLWNIPASFYLKKTLSKHKPDIIHLHNWHFAIGPVIIYVAKKIKVPIVLTLHNYRLLCPSGTLLYKRKLFMGSIHSVFPWKAIFKGVYRQSVFLTFWLSFVIWFHKLIGTWKKVDQYIVLTKFCKELFVNSSLGIHESKFSVKSNFVNSPPEILFDNIQDNNFLYVGRLSEEKGIHTLLKAFSNSPFTLLIVGDGPLKSYVSEYCTLNKNVFYLGSKKREDVQSLMQKCSSLVFPSIWYEPFGNVIIEAFSCGCPVIASDIGSPAELINNQFNGLHFETGNPEALKEKLVYWQSLAEIQKDEYRNNCLKTYELYYSPEKNKVQLLNIYSNILFEKGV